MSARAICEDCGRTSRDGSRLQAASWVRRHWCDQRYAREFRERRQKAAKAKAPAGSFTHGASGYTNYQCRCQTCRDGWSLMFARSKARRAARLAADPNAAPHGVPSTYNNYGCRCRPCTDAWTDNTNARKARRARREDAA